MAALWSRGRFAVVRGLQQMSIRCHKVPQYTQKQFALPKHCYSSDAGEPLSEQPYVIDMRSDVLTKPTKAMRQAMAESTANDVILGEDPTVHGNYYII